MTITYRILQPHDNAELARVIRNCFEEFDAVKPGTVYFDPTTDALYELFQTPDAHYIVAVDEQTNGILGGCGLYPTEGLLEGMIELVKFYLAPSARGKGVGKTLMSDCLKYAKAQGYNRVYLESLPELTIAVPMYERLGFVHLTHAFGNTGHTGCTIWMVKEL
jgi:putative acetyltransferase